MEDRQQQERGKHRLARVGWGTGLLLAQILLLGRVAQAAPVRFLVATAERVQTGDELTAIISAGRSLHVRLLGLKAPRIPQGKTLGEPFALEAREYLRGLLQGKTLRLWAYGRDRSKRMLVVLWVGTTNVNQALVREGLAEVQREDPCQVACALVADWEEVQRRAQQARRGMWALREREGRPERGGGL